MRIVPIKTNDVVDYADAKYVVSSVQLTQDGPIAVLQKIGNQAQIAHVSEIRLSDNTETLRRAKSVGIEDLSELEKEDETIKIPDGLNPSQKAKVSSIVKSFMKQVVDALGDTHE